VSFQFGVSFRSFSSVFRSNQDLELCVTPVFLLVCLGKVLRLASEISILLGR